jgi:hypothetical protein
LCTDANVSSSFSIGDKVDLLQSGVKVGEGSIFNTELGHKVHGRMVKKGCIVVKIEKVLKHDAPLPHPTGFEHTLGDALDSYEIWTESDLERHCHDHHTNIILTKGDYVDLIINGQVIGLGRVEYADTGTYYGREMVDAGYVTVLIIDVTQPHLILEDVDEGDIHPWKIVDLRHNIGK